MDAAALTVGAISARESSPLPIGRTLRAYLIEAKYETLNALRTPAFAIPFLAIPVVIYVLVGVFIAGGGEGEYGPGIANYLFSGFSVIGVIMPGVFNGVGLAIEREGNLLKVKCAETCL